MKRYNEWDGRKQGVFFERELARAAWPDGYACKACGGKKGSKLLCRPVWECGACGHQSSARAGTILHSTKMPLTKWVYAAAALALEPEITSLRLATFANVHWRTARSALQKMRAARDADLRIIKALAKAGSAFSGITDGRAQ